MRPITGILVAMLLVSLLCLYAVSSSKQNSSEGFEASAADDSALDSRVFNAWMAVHGVPPSPAHSSYYRNAAKAEELDDDALEDKIRKDAAVGGNGGSESGEPAQAQKSQAPIKATAPKATEQEAEDASATEEEMDAEVAGLADKVQARATMTAPIAATKRVVDDVRTKLKSIAGQVAALSKQFDPGDAPSTQEPRGVEQFISFR